MVSHCCQGVLSNYMHVFIFNVRVFLVLFTVKEVFITWKPNLRGLYTRNSRLFLKHHSLYIEFPSDFIPYLFHDNWSTFSFVFARRFLPFPTIKIKPFCSLYLYKHILSVPYIHFQPLWLIRNFHWHFLCKMLSFRGPLCRVIPCQLWGYYPKFSLLIFYALHNKYILK